MSTGLIITHARCVEHDPGPSHPEAPARLEAVLQALEDPIFAGLARAEAPAATRELLLRVHSPELIDLLFQAGNTGQAVRIDADTVMSPTSLQAALHAAGAGVHAVRAIAGGRHQRAFAAVRPPGHHATRRQSMGFCLFNNIAVAAAEAIEQGFARVAIVDFDVHHGNGTQDIFERDPRVLYVSSHQSPLYPGTGKQSERGVGNVVNAELAPSTGSMHFREVYREQLLPALRAFAPELILVSAGFDAHRLDPLANLNLGAEDYAWLTRELRDIRSARGRLVSMLEGGYSLTALRECTRAHVAALLL